MSTLSEPSRILSSEAKSILAPLGLKQKGRSRIWLDDHGWWVGVVEFQPSSWSQGSYLNVGCWLLWEVKDHISFDLGGRLEPHVRFIEQDRFRPEAKRLVIRAGEEIRRWRISLRTVASLASHYKEQNGEKQPPVQDFYAQLNAAITNGLIGDTKLANSLFSQIEPETSADYPWLNAQKQRATRMRNLTSDPDAFRIAIAEQVHQCRAINKLPQLTSLNFDGLQTF